MNTLDIFLKNHGSTRYKVYQRTGLSESTLRNMARRPLDTWKVNALFHLASVADLTPDKVFAELIQIERRVSNESGDLHKS